MNKVQIQLYGRTALVDEDQVSTLKRKESLISESVLISELFDVNKMTPQEIFDANEKLSEIGGKIIRLNRRIRKNVKFI